MNGCGETPGTDGRTDGHASKHKSPSKNRGTKNVYSMANYRFFFNLVQISQKVQVQTTFNPIKPGLF